MNPNFLQGSNTISKQDLSLFMSITREDENYSRVFLHKYPDVSTAVSNYFSAKEVNSSATPSPIAKVTIVKAGNPLHKEPIKLTPTVEEKPVEITALRRSPRKSRNKASASKDTDDVEGQAIIEALTSSPKAKEKENAEKEPEPAEKMINEDAINEEQVSEEDNQLDGVVLDESNEVEPEKPNDEPNSDSPDEELDDSKSSAVKFKIADDAAQFMAFTGCNQDVADTYIGRYGTIDRAINEYFAKENNEEFSAEEDEDREIKELAKPFLQTNYSTPFNVNKTTSYFGMNGVSGSQTYTSSSNSNSFGFPQFSARKRRGGRKNRKEIPPRSIQLGYSEPPALKLKGSYENYIKKHRSGPAPKDRVNEWPKFLGSVIADCRVTEWHLLSKMKIHDKLTFEAQPIEFNCVKSRRTRKNESGQRVVQTSDSWYVKGKSLDVRCLWKDKFIGFLSCENEEAFVFLLTKGYLILDGLIVSCPDVDEKSTSKFKGLAGTIRVQLDIFLTDEVIKNPLNVITTHPGRKKNGKKKEAETKEEFQSKEEQQAFQVLKLSKESFVKVFHILKIAVSIPTMVQLRQRIDPFQRIKKEKYGFKARGRTVMASFGAPAQVITDDFKEYYAPKQNGSKAVANLPLTVPKKKNASTILRDFDEEDKEDEDFNVADKELDPVDSIDSMDEDEDEDFDEDEIERLLKDSRNIQEISYKKYNPFSDQNGDYEGISQRVQNNQPKAQENGGKVDQDLLTTETQIASYYKAAPAPSTLKSELHVYQKQALSWMLFREEEIGNEDLFEQEFEQRELNDLFQEMVLLDGSKIYFNPFNGEISVDFPKLKACKGGILADEMGLGKTVMTIALLHANRREDKAVQRTAVAIEESAEADEEEEEEEEEDDDEEEDDEEDDNNSENKEDEKDEDEDEKGRRSITRSKSIGVNKSEKGKRTLKDFFNFKKDEKESPKKDSKRQASKSWVLSDEEWNVSDQEDEKNSKATKKVKLDSGYKETAKGKRSSSGKNKKSPKVKEFKLKKSTVDSESESDAEDDDEEVQTGKRILGSLRSGAKQSAVKKASGRSKLKEKAKSKAEKKKAENETKTTKKKPAKKTVKKAARKKAVVVNQKKKAGTLVVVPMTVLSQWKAEILKHSNPDTLTVHQYYGSSRKREELEKYDVVLTTYGLIESEFTQRHEKKKAGLFEYQWYRVILDEAHYIKSRVTSTSKAACSLTSEYRWCLTGTPLQNKLDDMFSLLQFLKVDTWGEYFWWNTYINKYTSTDEAANLIRGILKPMILRRTKKSTYLDGRNILELPPKDIKTHFVKLTTEERAIYNCFFQKSSQQFNEMVQGGTIQYEYAHVFELLIRLRQVCNHPSLVFSKEDLKDKGSLETAVYKFLEKRLQTMKENVAEAEGKREEKRKIKEIAKKAKEQKKKNKDKKGQDEEMDEEEEDEDEEEKENPQMQTEFIQQTIERLKKKDLEPCCICLEEIVDPAIANCGHIFCKECLGLSLKASKKCPLCQKEISAKDVMSIALQDQDGCRDLLDVNCATFKKSSKLIALIESIQEVAERGEKCVIFSQFLGMLNLVQRFIGDAKIKYTRVDGSSSMQARMKNIANFIEDKEMTVILISLKAGAIGLNLNSCE